MRVKRKERLRLFAASDSLIYQDIKIKFKVNYFKVFALNSCIAIGRYETAVFILN